MLNILQICCILLPFEVPTNPRYCISDQRKIFGKDLIQTIEVNAIDSRFIGVPIVAYCYIDGFVNKLSWRIRTHIFFPIITSSGKC